MAAAVMPLALASKLRRGPAKSRDGVNRAARCGGDPGRGTRNQAKPHVPRVFPRDLDPTARAIRGSACRAAHRTYNGRRKFWCGSCVDGPALRLHLCAVCHCQLVPTRLTASAITGLILRALR